MHADSRFPDASSAPSSPGTGHPLRGRWIFVPVDDPELARCVRHHDEPLRPSSDEPTRAEYLVRSTRPPFPVDVYVKGVIVHEGCPPLALAGWHKAVRCPVAAEEAERPAPEREGDHA